VSLKRRWGRADTSDVDTATASVEVARLRARVDALVQRRLAALERLAPRGDSPSVRQLEAMRFELAEVEWHLAALDATS
jgi:hypothetical protein